MIEYWHWHTLHFGTETYWVGILPHDQQPGRVYARAARLGADFRRAGRRVVGLRPDAQVGLLYSARSKWGLAFQASFPQPGATVVGSLEPISISGPTTGSSTPSTAAPSTPACRRGCIHDEQIVGPDGSRLSSRPRWPPSCRCSIVPGLLVADDDLLTGCATTPPPAGTS